MQKVRAAVLVCIIKQNAIHISNENKNIQRVDVFENFQYRMKICTYLCLQEGHISAAATKKWQQEKTVEKSMQYVYNTSQNSSLITIY